MFELALCFSLVCFAFIGYSLPNLSRSLKLRLIMFSVVVSFKNFKLSTKLNLILLTILLVIVTASGYTLSKILDNQIKQEVADRAFLIIETMNSVRNYTSTEVKPELVSKLASATQFIPETVPAYSARQIFSGLKEREEYQDFSYKEATINPTNPQDRANQFELKIVEQFRQNSDLKELVGFHSHKGKDLFYIARPLAIKQESCLECHSTPDIAPASLLFTYGDKHGFGWNLNEIVAAQIVFVPASKLITAANSLKLLVIGLISIFFLIGMLVLNIFLKFSIIKPIKRMAHLSTEVSTGNFTAEFTHSSQDEIGILTKAFNRMKLSLQMAMNMLNQEE